MPICRSGPRLCSARVYRPARFTLSLNSRRCYATPGIRFSPRISTIFGALLTVGLATTAFGLYEFYSMFTLWPPEVRSDLRAAVKAKHQDDLDLSERYFQRAWEVAQTLPLSLFGSAPFLKTTGILIAYAEVLEKNNRPKLAYELMADYLEKLPPQSPDLELGTTRPGWKGPERMRLVAIAYKLGEMANTYSQPEDAEKKWLTFAVTEMLATLVDENKNKGGRLEMAPTFQELQLPQWVSKIDAAAPLKALGDFYARIGNVPYALNLYRSTFDMLVHNRDLAEIPLHDRCRSAEVISNLAELLTRPSSTPEPAEETKNRLIQAEHFALMAAKSMIDSSEDVSFTNEPACLECFAVIYANLGTINMMNGQPSEAKKFYEAGLRHAMTMGYKDQITQIRGLIREAERAGNSTPLLK